MTIRPSPRRRAVPTEASKARAARIADALSGLLEDSQPPHAWARIDSGDPYRSCEVPRCDPTPPVDLVCPVCTEAMARERYEGLETHRCGGCDGLWLAAGELEGIASTPRNGSPNVGELRRHMSQVAPAVTEIRYRRCPRCRDVMNRVNFGATSGIIVDECRSHGVFLDAGEFEAIETFIALGGLALARERVAERVRANKTREELGVAIPGPPARAWGWLVILELLSLL